MYWILKILIKKMALYYLTGNDWNTELAAKEYNEDLEWEK